MKKVFADIELADGQEITVRVTLPSKLQWSKTARANGWEFDDPQQNAFVAWHAAKLQGLIPESVTYEAFCNGEAVDVEVRHDESSTQDAEENPTS